MNHPTPAEIREWMKRLEKGQATTGMIERVVAGYEALWRVMLNARQVAAKMPETNDPWDPGGGWKIIIEDWDLEALEKLDDAIESFGELKSEQMELIE